jgi:phosphatidate phosphatase APP1
VNKLSRFLGAFGISMLLLNLAFAQDFRGTITGRVMDASKASIPNATVTVKNTATNETFTATTDNEGNYKVPFLRPGDYTITVEASGFKKAGSRFLARNRANHRHRHD